MDLQQYPNSRWTLAESAWFRRTKDTMGDFSNFAKQMPIRVHGFRVRSSEHLYQTMRFPHLPDVQFQILEADSPKSCKTIARDFEDSTREDWMEIRIAVMRYVLARKIKANAKRMAKVFKLTAEKSIVEYSKRDPFWGAQPISDGDEIVVGQNVLGCLLTELREVFAQDPLMRTESKPCFPRALFLSEPL